MKMAQQKIIIANVKAGAENVQKEFELPEVNKYLGEGFFVKSWQAMPNHVNEVISLIVLLEKLESKPAPGLKYGNEMK
jgi:hypothetical protein